LAENPDLARAARSHDKLLKREEKQSGKTKKTTKNSGKATKKTVIHDDVQTQEE
jgi:hypothetical protein